jgi:type III secretion system low calcium response chaperone LcrH/SycD
VSSEAASHFDAQIAEWIKEVNEGTNSLSQMTEEKIQDLYFLAFSLYREERYQDASYFFRLLAVAQPSDAKNWKGLGACLQMVQEYEDALHCYMSAQILNQEKPDPYLYVHAADCYFALKQKESGLKTLEAARLAAEETQDRRVLQHVALMRELWK